MLQSRKEDRIATQVDFEGPFDDPDVDYLGAIGLLLKNAFYKMIGAEKDDRKNSASKFHRGLKLLKDSAVRWSQNEAMRMSAALSYYTAFSIAPLLQAVIATRR